MSTNTLHLTLHRQWFDAILAGTKKEEYREIKPFWEKRLARRYETITFRNGYASDAPMMVVEHRGTCTKRIKHPIHGRTMKVYAIKLGRVVATANCHDPCRDLRRSSS